MVELGEDYPDLVALGADGYSIYEDFSRRFPQRFVDVGIAEANLVGVASGLAQAGKRVFVGTIAPFLVRRAQEQIRNDVCNAALNVTFVGVGGGFSYGTLGPTHHLIEDFAIFRTMPNATILAPADAYDAAWALRVAARIVGPVYVRLGAREDPVVHRGDEHFQVGEPYVLRPGRDITIMANGICVAHALCAADQLAAFGTQAEVLNVNCIKPINRQAVLESARGRRLVIVVEEHSEVGGLGSLVSDILGGEWPGKVLRLAVDDRCPPVGTREELLEFYGLTGATIVSAAMNAVQAH
jgi:transketolase